MIIAYVVLSGCQSLCMRVHPSKKGTAPRARFEVTLKTTFMTPMGKVKSELKTVDQIRKSRKIMEQKRAKNARPTRRKGRR